MKPFQLVWSRLWRLTKWLFICWDIYVEKLQCGQTCAVLVVFVSATGSPWRADISIKVHIFPLYLNYWQTNTFEGRTIIDSGRIFFRNGVRRWCRRVAFRPLYGLKYWCKSGVGQVEVMDNSRRAAKSRARTVKTEDADKNDTQLLGMLWNMVRFQ